MNDTTRSALRRALMHELTYTSRGVVAPTLSNAVTALRECHKHSVFEVNPPLMHLLLESIDPEFGIHFTRDVVVDAVLLVAGEIVRKSRSVG